MRRGGGGRKVTTIALALLGVVVVLLLVAQLVLPHVAASRISSRIGKYGHVTSVHVNAFPAVKLLWKDADSVTVRATHVALSPKRTDELLAEARGTSRLDLRAASAHEGPLTVSDVHLTKRGGAVHVSAFASVAAVSAALPPGIDATLVGSSGGKVEVRASGGLFGLGASIAAVAEAREGKLVVHPAGPLIGALHLTLFDEPHVKLQSIAARAANGPEGEAGYELEADATLR